MALIIPEIFANAVNEKLDTSLRIGRVAFNATDYVPDIRTSGETIHFPTIDRVAIADTVTKGTELTPELVTMTDSTAMIKWVGSSMRVFDSEKAQIKGAVMDNVIEQVATAMAKKIDSDLVDAIDEEVVFKIATANESTITATELFSGLQEFGDDVDTNSFAGIIVNSKLYGSFLNMSEFVSNNFTYQTDNNGKVANGVIGYFLGIPVILCDNNTWDKNKSEAKTYIVKKNSIGYIFQKEVTVEEEREAKLLATDIVASSLYATKLLNSKGVVVLRKTIA